MSTYRLARAVLAGSALLGLAVFAGWHLLLWRMQCVYRLEAGS